MAIIASGLATVGAFAPSAMADVHNASVVELPATLEIRVSWKTPEDHKCHFQNGEGVLHDAIIRFQDRDGALHLRIKGGAPLGWPTTVEAVTSSAMQIPMPPQESKTSKNFMYAGESHGDSQIVVINGVQYRFRFLYFVTITSPEEGEFQTSERATIEALPIKPDRLSPRPIRFDCRE